MPIRVLLADDHTIVRSGLALLLKSADDLVVVGEAADGRRAVQEVQRLKPDVVVMDIAMPELNGIEATQQICESCSETQVVILSVYATLDHISMALKAGAKGYLLKGSAAQEVVDAIRGVHKGHYCLSNEITDAVIKDYVRDRKESQSDGSLRNLTSREREILQMVVEGKTNSEIADMLGLAVTSAAIYRSRLMKKLGTKDLPSLVKLAIQQGLTAL
jgi:DNA-binding NarL/FixJ family response regulator